MIAIVDYGMGNLRSVQKGFERTGYQAVITDRPEDIVAARAVVLPGVGAFRDGMENLRQRGLVNPIIEAIIQEKPFLGICLGLHFLFSHSEEFGFHRGLDFLAGKVVRLPDRMGKERLKIPHMGWNTLCYPSESESLERRNMKDTQPPKLSINCPLLEGIPDSTYVYFVHSYYAVPQDSTAVVATTRYGVEFPSMLWRGNLFATQFHPEKSQQVGLRILKNFGKLVEFPAAKTS